MILNNRRKNRDTYIPQCSQADVAFLLLLFFLVTTSMDIDKGLGLTLPPKGQAKPIPKKNIASILINATGEVLLDEQEVQIPRIKELIKQRLAQNPLLIVSIKTDRETKYQQFVSVLDQVQMAEAPRISIAEPEK
jgi:biopolymer transport protein ExbD